ncbi:MAG: MarR family transcriptional regulator [Paludibacteraceae bacterium]|nr:MarR family transcriptional regulator [Paludibacteraceae bacterium]
MKYFERLTADEIEQNIAFVREHDNNIWWFDGEKVSFRSPNTPTILRTIMEEPDTTINELCDKIGINRSAIQKQLDLLHKKGYIVRSNDGNGKWHVVIVSSI